MSVTPEALEASAQALARRGVVRDAASARPLVEAFLARWPSLPGSLPTAFLAVERALRAFGPPAFGAPSRLAVHDLELEALAAGERRGCLKENVPAADVEGLVAAYRAMGFAAGLAERHGLVEGGDRHVAGEARAIVAVAVDAATLAQALELFAAHRGEERARAVRAMGELLGYPACCAEAFAQVSDRGDNLANETLPFRRAPDAALSPLLHRVARTPLVSHFPCRPDCAFSVDLATRGHRRLSADDAGAAASLLAELGAPVLFVDYHRRASLEGTCEADRFRVARLTPIGAPFLRDMKAIRELRLSAGAVHVTSDSGTQTLEAPGAFLTLPGSPLPPMSLAALGLKAPARASGLAGRLVGATGLGAGWTMGETRATDGGTRHELVLGHEDGTTVVAVLEALVPGARAYARLATVALSYRSTPGLDARRVVAAMELLRTRLDAAERAGRLEGLFPRAGG